MSLGGGTLLRGSARARTDPGTVAAPGERAYRDLNTKRGRDAETSARMAHGGISSMSRQQPTQARGESRVDRIHRQMLESVAAAAKARAKADEKYRQALAKAAAEHVPYRDLGKAAGTTASNVHRLVKAEENARP